MSAPQTGKQRAGRDCNHAMSTMFALEDVQKCLFDVPCPSHAVGWDRISENSEQHWDSLLTTLISEDESFQKLVAMAPLFKHFNMLPGEFGINAYSGDFCCQFLSVGMKLYGHQQHMYDTAPRLGNIFCHELPPDQKSTIQYKYSLVTWCLDAVLLPRDHASVQNHGDSSKTIGPIPFCTQTGIITKTRPYSSAVALDTPSVESYYVSLRPCEGLEAFQKAINLKWPSGAPSNFQSAKDLVEFTFDIATILDQCFRGMSVHYTATQVARKVALIRGERVELPAGDLTMELLRKASPDATRTMAQFPGDMPAAALERVFGVWAPHWSMYRCMLRPVMQSASWIRCHLGLLEHCLDEFRHQHGFNPKPQVLCKLAEEKLAQSESVLVQVGLSSSSGLLNVPTHDGRSSCSSLLGEPQIADHASSAPPESYPTQPIVPAAAATTPDHYKQCPSCQGRYCNLAKHMTKCCPELKRPVGHPRLVVARPRPAEQGLVGDIADATPLIDKKRQLTLHGTISPSVGESKPKRNTSTFQ